MNIKRIRLPGPVLFHSHYDHSKWCVSQAYEDQVTCLGDLNREKTQLWRGGGLVCTFTPLIYKAFRQVVDWYLGCWLREKDRMIRTRLFWHCMGSIVLLLKWPTCKQQKMQLSNSKSISEFNLFDLCFCVLTPIRSSLYLNVVLRMIATGQVLVNSLTMKAYRVTMLNDSRCNKESAFMCFPLQSKWITDVSKNGKL